MILKKIDIEKLKSIQLDILQNVHDFCEKNNIFYSITYGTLIGAIRHKGYIPWDDDIDICMPRPDYNLFLNTFNDFNQRYQVVSYELDTTYPLPYAKVMDKNTILIENTNLKYEFGINIDVFPIDGIKLKTNVLKRQIIYNKILSLKAIKLSIDRSFLKNFVLLIGKILFCLISTKRIIKKMVRNSQLYPYDTSEFVSGIAIGSKFNHPVNKSLFNSKFLIEFEGKKVCVINGYDEYLKSIFGDYMKLPPKDKQVSHHYFQAFLKDGKS